MKGGSCHGPAAHPGDCVLPRYQNRGIGQRAIEEAERLHGSDGWELDTILQERGNCHLYEKMGYRPTGRTGVANHRLTLVFYEKNAVKREEDI